MQMQSTYWLERVLKMTSLYVNALLCTLQHIVIYAMQLGGVNSPTEPCALQSTQPLKLSTRDFFWGKGGRCIWLTTYYPCSAEKSRKSGTLSYPKPLGPPRPVAGHLYFTLYIYIYTHTYTHTHTNFLSQLYMDSRSGHLTVAVLRWV